MWSDGFVAFDTETTGFGPDARIVEVGCVTFERGEAVHEWSQLIDPGPGVDWNNENVKKAMSVNGIDYRTLAGQPTFEQVIPTLLMELAMPVWCAHNADFDVRMLNQELARFGAAAQLKTPLLVCTKNLAAHFRNGASGNTLKDVACRYNVAQESAHRATADAVTCGRVLLRMRELGLIPADDASLEELARVAAKRWNGRR